MPILFFSGQPMIHAFWKDWMFISFLIVLSLFIIALYFNPRYLQQSFRSIFSYQIQKVMFGARSSLTQRSAILLDLLFFINIGIFIYACLQIVQFEFPLDSSLLSFILTLFLFPAYMLGKLILYLLVGSFSDTMDATNEYLSNDFTLKRWFGILLLPGILIIPYIPVGIAQFVMYFYVVIFVAMAVLKVFRGFQIAAMNKFSFIYIILYLCALELLPTVILIKFLANLDL